MLFGVKTHILRKVSVGVNVDNSIVLLSVKISFGYGSRFIQAVVPRKYLFLIVVVA